MTDVLHDRKNHPPNGVHTPKKTPAAPRPRLSRRGLPRSNYPTGLGSLIWLGIVGLPLYVLVAATFQTRDGYIDDGPPPLPDHPTLADYRRVPHPDFVPIFLVHLFAHRQLINGLMGVGGK